VEEPGGRVTRLFKDEVLLPAAGGDDEGL
jgi:hypothetical protein